MFHRGINTVTYRLPDCASDNVQAEIAVLIRCTMLSGRLGLIHDHDQLGHSASMTSSPLELIGRAVALCRRRRLYRVASRQQRPNEPSMASL